MMSFDKYIQLYNDDCSQYIEHFHYPPKPFCTPLQSVPFPQPQPWQLLIDFCPSSFAFCRMSCKWNHTVCSIFCLLLSLTVILVCSFSLLSGILLYGQSTVYPFPCWWTFALFPVFGDYE